MVSGSNLISPTQSVKSADTKTEPYIKGVVETCKYKKEDICDTGLCGVQTQSARSSRARGRSVAAPMAAASNGNVIWQDGSMLIEAVFSYFDDNRKYIRAAEAHQKIKAIRQKLAYFGSGSPKSTYNEYANRSLISTHQNSGERVFIYNNVGDAQIGIIDNRWTIYDQKPTDDLGRTRAVKCVVASGVNSTNGALNGCNVEMTEVVKTTYVPDFIEINPTLVQVKFRSNVNEPYKRNKPFTYFANRVSNSASVVEANLDNEMQATYKVEAIAYVSDEIYGRPTQIDGQSQNKPLIAYGYEYDKFGTAREVDFDLNFAFDCSNYEDRKIANNISQRCSLDSSSITEEIFSKDPLDSRCHGSANSAKNFELANLKAKYNIFNFDTQTTQNGARKYKILLENFRNGRATKGNTLYFNFDRTLNYPTNPKVINVNDFNATKIVQVGFAGANKSFIKPKNGEQPNKFEYMDQTVAIGNNAHFYYGYVNSPTKVYYIQDDKNRGKVDIMVFGSVAFCVQNPTLCNGEFLDVYKKDFYVPDRGRLYRNPFDNYSGEPFIKDFVSKYELQIKRPDIQIERSTFTVDGEESIYFNDVPSNFPEDNVRVFTRPWFVYSDGRGKINENTPYNIFKIVGFQMNTWGGEGSVKSYNNNSILPIQGGSKIEYDTLGKVPMGKDLQGTSKSLSRRIRY